MARQIRLATTQIAETVLNLETVREEANEAVATLLETLQSCLTEGMDDAVARVVESVLHEHGRGYAPRYDATTRRTEFPLPPLNQAYQGHLDTVQSACSSFEAGVGKLLDQLLSSVNGARAKLMTDVQAADCTMGGLPVLHDWEVIRELTPEELAKPELELAEEHWRQPDIGDRIIIVAQIYGSERKDGTFICTSILIEADKHTVKTYGGSRYALGTPNQEWIEWLNEQRKPLDEDDPFYGELDPEEEEDDDEGEEDEDN